MREITKDNYKQLEYNWGGIIVAYPKVDLFFNADFYFIKQKINYETDERIYFYSGVNQEDEVSEISPDWKKQDFESCFKDWENLKYYQFENMEDFCNWYIHRYDKAIKQFKEMCDISLNAFDTSDITIYANKRKIIKRKDKLKDIIEYTEKRLDLFWKQINQYFGSLDKEEVLKERQYLDNWLGEEICEK